MEGIESGVPDSALMVGCNEGLLRILGPRTAEFSLCRMTARDARSIPTRYFNANPFPLPQASLIWSVKRKEGTFARRVPGAPGIQINVQVVHPHALPLDITPSSSPGTLSTNDTTEHNCR